MPFQRLLSLWNWLPTFRAVAEREHISSAADSLGVSASAVSRMIGLLEGEVGQPLFARVGRRVELNEAGEHLLSALRTAMRIVDESLAAIGERQYVGPVHIASVEPVTRAFLLPAIEELRRAHPELTPSIHMVHDADVQPRLLDGTLDVAFVRRAPAHAELSCVRLGTLPTGVYAGKTHPLFSARRAGTQVAQHHPFVAIIGDEDAPGKALWPSEIPRRVALRVQGFALATAACETGNYLAVLPDRLAAPLVEEGALRRLPISVTSPVELYAVWRKRLESGAGRGDAVVEAATKQIRQAMA